MGIQVVKVNVVSCDSVDHSIDRTIRTGYDYYLVSGRVVCAECWKRMDKEALMAFLNIFLERATQDQLQAVDWDANE